MRVLLLSPTIEMIILVTAIVNVVAIIPLFFTCRFIPTWKPTQKITHYNWHKFLYKYHSLIWWFLVPSVLLHAIIAIIHKLNGG